MPLALLNYGVHDYGSFLVSLVFKKRSDCEKGKRRKKMHRDSKAREELGAVQINRQLRGEGRHNGCETYNGN